MSERFIIESHPSIETASKEVCFPDGEPYTGQLSQITNWAVAVALNSFPIGSEITEEAFEDALRKAMVDQTLSDLVDKGTLEMSFDEKQNDFVFRLPPTLESEPPTA